jgi:hypothetical protein
VSLAKELVLVELSPAGSLLCYTASGVNGLSPFSVRSRSFFYGKKLVDLQNGQARKATRVLSSMDFFWKKHFPYEQTSSQGNKLFTFWEQSRWCILVKVSPIVLAILSCQTEL